MTQDTIDDFMRRKREKMAAAGETRGGRVSKYRAVRTTVDGITFASKAEARRYQELRMLERARKITGLRLQPRYDLHVNGQKIGTYVGDFEYVVRHGGTTVTEDVKGMKTPMYRWKKKHLKAQWGIEIQEVR